MAETTPILVVSNLRKTFTISAKQRKINVTDERRKVALDDLSFTANSGEIFGLLGPNGAGKTTALRIISTLIKADSGVVTLGGYSVKEHPDKIRQMIGFLTTELRLEDFFTPNYLFDFFCGLRHIPKETAERRKKELFERFEIDKYAEVKVASLSTGMKQKLSLVISIAHDPEVIILDEPTNGLDVIVAREVEDYLLELKASGKTMILSTHLFPLVEKLCDRVGIIFDGKMALCAPTEEILQGGKRLEDAFFDLHKKWSAESAKPIVERKNTSEGAIK